MGMQEGGWAGRDVLGCGRLESTRGHWKVGENGRESLTHMV